MSTPMHDVPDTCPEPGCGKAFGHDLDPTSKHEPADRGRRACERCGYIHTSSDTVAVGRFGTPAGYVAANGNTPTRATRAEAEADQCEWRQSRPVEPVNLPEPPAIQAPAAPREDPPPFPAAAMETLARAKAWADFLAQVRFSLIVWELDPEVRAGCEPVTEWIASCRIDALSVSAGES